uniref:Odorant receptor n=2 Tax=Lutzomyia longipalpis TaxID=7200 RepID=A0A240SXV7_LUTLO
MVNLQSKVEFLKITKLISFSIRCIIFDFGLISKISGKFFFPFYVLINIYLTINKIPELLEAKNVLELWIQICTTIGLGGVFIKVFTICYYEEEIFELFKWIEDFFLDNAEPILAKLRAKSLDKTLWILKLFLKFYITSLALIVTYGNFFYLINDIQVINIPWEVSKSVNVYLQILLYFTYIFMYGIPIMCFGCMGIIFIGILKFYNESIALLEKTEKDLLEDGFILILHKLHCEIHRKFCIYEKIFLYFVFFDIVFNAGPIIGLLIIIRLYPYMNIFYIIFVLIVSQQLIYCIFGQLIFTETEKISDRLYLTKWYDMKREDKQFLLLMMMMSSRPFGLKAAGMYAINIVLFVKIMKLCFSYYAILYTFL